MSFFVSHLSLLTAQFAVALCDGFPTFGGIIQVFCCDWIDCRGPLLVLLICNAV